MPISKFASLEEIMWITERLEIMTYNSDKAIPASFRRSSAKVPLTISTEAEGRILHMLACEKKRGTWSMARPDLYYIMNNQKLFGYSGFSLIFPDRNSYPLDFIYDKCLMWEGNTSTHLTLFQFLIENGLCKCEFGLKGQNIWRWLIRNTPRPITGQYLPLLLNSFWLLRTIGYDYTPAPQYPNMITLRKLLKQATVTRYISIGASTAYMFWPSHDPYDKVYTNLKIPYEEFIRFINEIYDTNWTRDAREQATAAAVELLSSPVLYLINRNYQLARKAPLSLQEISRNSIRTSLGTTAFRCKLESLPLAPPMKEYCRIIPTLPYKEEMFPHGDLNKDYLISLDLFQLTI